MRYLREKALTHLGDDVVLITTDGSGDGYLKCGTLEGVYSTVDFGMTSKCVTFNNSYIVFFYGGRRSRDRMIVGFTTTCAISAYHN